MADGGGSEPARERRARKALDLAPGAIKTEYLRHSRHELRTPLNHILGYSEILLETAADLDLAAFLPDLERIRAAGQHLLGQVDRHLGPAPADGRPLDVTGLSHELRTPLNAILGYTELLLDAAAEQGLRDLALDLEKVQAATKHLLGSIEYLLDLERLETAGLLGEAAATPAPRTARAAPTGALTTAPAAPPPDQGVLLIVDDNALNCDVLARRLTRLGYEVVTAQSGASALELLHARPFDLVLLDVLMPEMDGYEVLARLKADPELRHLPVVVLSALDELDSVVRCIALGADDYLPKPFNPQLLRARIGNSLEKKRLRDQEVWYRQQIEAERQRADELLHVILPHEIVQELKTTNAVQPRRYDRVAVLFCDIVNFTPYCDQRQPQEVVASLQQLVEVYEELVERHEMQKIKTIGDAFMAVAGLLTPADNPVRRCVEAGLEMIAAAPRVTPLWNVRVGIHVGPVVAGVLGRRQYLFDLWGDTVNTAARMESAGVAGTITLSATAWQEVAAYYQGECVGAVPIKGKGQLDIVRLAPLAASPNARQRVLRSH